MLVKERSGKYITERRRYPRKPLKLWVRYQCLQQNQHHACESTAEDLGAGGLAMRSDRMLGLGELLMLTLFLPPVEKRLEAETGLTYAKHEGLPAAVLSRVAWCVPSDNNDFILGVQFLDLDRENRKRLKSFLIEFSLDHPDSRLYV